MKQAEIPDGELVRLRELASFEILDTLPEQEYDDIVALAAYICGAPIALVSLIDEHRQWFKARIGLKASETPRQYAFCAHAILNPDQVFEVDDALKDPRFADNPLVLGDPKIRFYAGAPIVGDDGSPFGTVCVIDTVARTLDSQQLALLQGLARQTSSLLKVRRQALRAQEHAVTLAKLTDAARLDRSQSQELLNLALRSGDFGLWDLDVPSGTWTINDREREILGLSASEAQPEKIRWHTLIHEEDLGPLDRALREHMAGSSAFYECEHRMRHKLGHWVWVHTRACVVARSDQQPIRIVGTHQDVTLVRDDRLALDTANELLRRTNALARVGGWEFDPKTGEITWSDEVYRIHELPLGGETDLTQAINFYSQSSRPLLEAAIENCLKSGTPYDLELQMVTAKGRPIWVRAQGTPALTDGRVVRLVGAFQDITDRKLSELALLEANARLAKLSMTDGLTGIGNRRLFEDALASEWRRLARKNASMALLMIDVDHFKMFNDEFGHVSGDVCLKRIALALSGCLGRQGDLLARFGGEEFAILLPETSAEGAAAVAKTCLAAVAAERIQASQRGSGLLYMSISIGIAAVNPRNDKLPSSLVDAADAALYRAKHGGRARVSL